MRILLISDIHANYRALKAVLDKFGTADEVWCLGDIVEYGPSPARCIDLVRGHCRHVVQGNHDLTFVEYQPDRDDLNVWASFERDADNLAYLRDLPTSLSVVVDGTTYFLVHGSPMNHLSGSLRPQTDAVLLREAMESSHADAILCGHTHMAMIRRVGDKFILNTGTVGQPRDGDYRAQCILIEDGAFRFERVDYDLDALKADYQRAPLPDDVKETWFGYAKRGIVDVHGLQLGPFSVQS